MEQIRRIMRPTDVPDQGLLCDLLWSDPDKVSYCYNIKRRNILKDNTYNLAHSIQTLYKQHHTSFVDNEVINVAM